jgi:hypothetical protein
MTDHQDRDDVPPEVPGESPQRIERPDPDGSPGRRPPFQNDPRGTEPSPGRDEAPAGDRRRRGDSPWLGGG